MILEIRDERQLRALTGLSQEQFEQLLSEFSQVYQERQESKYQQAVAKGERQRRAGGGRKSKLATMADKLQFVLYYFKTYPTFDVLGTQFKLARSKAHENLYQLSPILQETLVRLEMMPAREFKTVEEMMQVLKGIDQIIIDATERAYRRPQDATEQEAHYSGKKNDTQLKIR